MAGMYCMSDLLELSLRAGAEELSLHTGEAPVMKIRGESSTIEVAVMTTDDLTKLFQSIATEEQLKELHTCGDVHFVYQFQNSVRFAVAAKFQREAFNVEFKNLGRAL